MTRGALIFILIAIWHTGFGQDHFASTSSSIHYARPAPPSTELGVFIGASYYNGELNRSAQFNSSFTHIAYGIMFRRNLNARYSLRINGFYGKLSGDDASSDDILAQLRNANFTSSLFEASGGIEFNFFPFNPADKQTFFTPYVFVGVGVFKFSSRSRSNTSLGNFSVENAKYSTVQGCMPFGIGLKFKTGYRLLIALEWSPRKTWTDYIDDVSSVYPTSGLQRGNSKNNDWYTIAGLCLTYRLGEKLTDCAKWDKHLE